MTAHGWPSFRVLGRRVDGVQIRDVMQTMAEWVARGEKGHVIVAANAHVITECHRDPLLKEAVDSASIVMPDGMPLVLLGRHAGLNLPDRAYGPKLMETCLALSGAHQYRHFFYGGSVETLEGLTNRILSKWPSTTIAGTYSPPFRALSPDEQQRIVAMINDASPDILWVGLGCPKQEHWMHQHRSSLRVPVMIGVGQAFDILGGSKQLAPAWMRNHGLEWAYRLWQEPRRLWRRYLLGNPAFVFLVALQLLRLRKYE